MSEEEILRQEELEKKRKEEWWHRHPFRTHRDRSRNNTGTVLPL